MSIVTGHETELPAIRPPKRSLPAIPEEGGLMLAYAVVSPKGSGNREETAKYMNYLASAESQVSVSVHGGGIPTNNTAQLPQEYLDTLGTKLDACGLTVHEAVGRAISTASHIDGLPRDIRRLRIAAPESLDKETRTEIDGDARMVVDRLDGAGRIATLWRSAPRHSSKTGWYRSMAAGELTGSCAATEAGKKAKGQKMADPRTYDRGRLILRICS